MKITSPINATNQMITTGDLILIYKKAICFVEKFCLVFCSMVFHENAQKKRSDHLQHRLGLVHAEESERPGLII